MKILSMLCFFSSQRRHTRSFGDWSSDVCSSDLEGTVAQKLIWHQVRQPTPIQKVRADVPEGLVAVLEKMMAKDPAARYQTPTEVAEALAPLMQTPIGPPPEE